MSEATASEAPASEHPERGVTPAVTPAVPPASAGAPDAGPPTQDGPTDEALMARVRTHDASAFQALVRRHGRGVQRFAQRLLRQPDDADDVAQDALLRVWQHAERWEDDRVRFSTWLYRIAHNLCVDRLRRQQRQRTDAMDGEQLDRLPDTAAGPERRAHDADLRRQLEAALATLPERQRSALLMCFHQGLSNRQAAEVLGVSVEALESLLARARRALRNELGDALADVRAGVER